MKIIGKGDRTVILEAHEDEVANLIGHYYAGDASMPRNALGVGAEILVAGMFRRLYTLEKHKGELSRLAKQLRAQADLLESVDPVIEAATQPDGEEVRA